MELVFEVPFPPSVNHYWRHVRGRVMISSPGRRYREAVRRVVYAGRLSIEMRGRIGIDLVAFPPDKRRRDLDNMLKAILDALQAAGVYKDDSQIDELCIIRGKQVAGGMMLVTIKELREQ